MTAIQKQVREFHETFECPIRNLPTVPSSRELELRGNLILEEVKEFCDAAGLYISMDSDGKLRASRNPLVAQPDLVEMADAIGDINYVVEGAALCLGLNSEAIGEEVHRSNMTKVWPDGTVHRREDGKVVKPPSYSKPDILAVLAQQKEYAGVETEVE